MVAAYDAPAWSPSGYTLNARGSSLGFGFGVCAHVAGIHSTSIPARKRRVPTRRLGRAPFSRHISLQLIDNTMVALN
jgi:hypothetical protein